MTFVYLSFVQSADTYLSAHAGRAVFPVVSLGCMVYTATALPQGTGVGKRNHADLQANRPECRRYRLRLRSVCSDRVQRLNGGSGCEAWLRQA